MNGIGGRHGYLNRINLSGAQNKQIRARHRKRRSHRLGAVDIAKHISDNVVNALESEPRHVKSAKSPRICTNPLHGSPKIELHIISIGVEIAIPGRM